MSSKKTLVGLPAASFFGQAAGGPPTPGPQPQVGQQREATQEVSLADMSISSLLANGAGAPEQTQEVSAAELTPAAEPSHAAPFGLPSETPTTDPRRAGLPRWTWLLAAAVPLLVGGGWLATRGTPSAQPVLPAAHEPPAVAASQALPSVVDEPPSAAPSPPVAAPQLGGADAAQTRADGLVEQAELLRRRRKLGPARAKYQAALKATPGHQAALLGLTRVALQTRDGKRAVQLASELTAAHPDDASYHLLLGDAYKLARKPRDAREAYQQAARLGSSSARRRLK